MTDFSSLPARAQARLASISAAASGVVPYEIRKWTIETRSLVASGGEPQIISEVREWSEKGCLYLYHMTISSSITDPSDLSEAYTAARTLEKGTRAYARINKPSLCLYVGSSAKIHQRLKEHLGYGARSTYSLQLAHWAKPFDLEVELECAKYPAGTDPKGLQALEDTHWSELRPMFGRQGAR